MYISSHTVHVHNKYWLLFPHSIFQFPITGQPLKMGDMKDVSNNIKLCYKVTLPPFPFLPKFPLKGPSDVLGLYGPSGNALLLK